VGTTERVLAQRVESAVPTLPKQRAADFVGEPLDRAVAGTDVAQRGGGVGSSASDPLMLAVGLENLRQSRESVLFVSEEPSAVPVSDAFMVRCAADDDTADVAAGHAGAAGRAAPRLDDLLCGGQRQPPDRVPDCAEWGHRVDQGGRAPAGQGGEPRQPLRGPVADRLSSRRCCRDGPSRDERCPMVRWLASASRFR
jgi:hypothetical protein